MSATTAAPPSHPEAPTQPRPRNHRARRPRNPKDNNNASATTTEDEMQQEGQVRRNGNNRGGRARPARDALLALRPASVAPSGRPQQGTSNLTPLAPSFTPVLTNNHSSATPTAYPATFSASETNNQTRATGGRNHRGKGQQSIVQTRHFGGALTETGEGSSIPVNSTLQPNAVHFQPGQITTSSTGPPSRQRQPQPRKRRASKSTAPDFATRIHEDINNKQYECPICTSEVLRNSKVWSCKKCWTVFHLDCVKKWSSNADSVVAQPNGQNGEAPMPRQWRCPGCNLPQEVKPTSYTCWCGKDHEPRSISGLPPHSCGQTCGKPRDMPKKCPHPCELLCHAGPCPPCTHIGPTQRCFCGKDTTTRRCVETQYEGGWSCQKICGDIMPCGEHTCTRECHDGLCGACEVPVMARCYCGKHEKTILCCDKDDEEESFRDVVNAEGKTINEQWAGVFQCADTCGRYFDCGKHQCSKPCHTQVRQTEHCPRSPDIISHCPCGKTKLEEMFDKPRQNCEDPIPNCSKTCLKSLSCGHPCQQTCHTGECMPCLQNVTIHCRCGRTASTTICHQGTEEPPQCTRICRTTLNCGRHECGERCCPGERKATERQQFRRKTRQMGSTTNPLDDGFEAEHICTRSCGRLLKCGNHFCQELCHKGACSSCREAIFDEISCNCGRTILQPPLPCGTTPPHCRFDCERPKACGHPQVAHNCHLDDDLCPRCPFLVEKTCLCEKKTLKNQQCWFTDVKCGAVCGRKLKCGSHTCRKTCHKPGECEDATGPCQQACGRPKKVCGHPCEDTCHAPYPCREEKPCPHKLIITCDCQNHKQETRCNASKTSEGNTTKSLKCDDECARLERNRKLALALDIDPATHKDDHIPYAQETLNLFQEHPKWSQEQEREFRVFAADEHEKRLRFKPMPAQQRAFLHQLADDFGFDSESMDPEPHRHVAIFKTPRFVSAPTKTLRECVRIRQSQRVADADAKAKAKSSIVSEPYNGFLLSSVRFALTLDELHTEVAAVQGPNAKLHFTVQFLSSGDVALKALSGVNTERTIDFTLKELRLPLARAFNSVGYGSLQLCRFDESLNVLRRELDSASEGGWSQVAAKAAAPRKAPTVVPIGAKSSFTVLGSLTAKKKKQKEEKRVAENVIDDWEVAELLEEEKEEKARRSVEIERGVEGGNESQPEMEEADGLGEEKTGVEDDGERTEDVLAVVGDHKDKTETADGIEEAVAVAVGHDDTAVAEDDAQRVEEVAAVVVGHVEDNGLANQDMDADAGHA